MRTKESKGGGQCVISGRWQQSAVLFTVHGFHYSHKCKEGKTNYSTQPDAKRRKKKKKGKCKQLTVARPKNLNIYTHAHTNKSLHLEKSMSTWACPAAAATKPLADSTSKSHSNSGSDLINGAYVATYLALLLIWLQEFVTQPTVEEGGSPAPAPHPSFQNTHFGCKDLGSVAWIVPHVKTHVRSHFLSDIFLIVL